MVASDRTTDDGRPPRLEISTAPIDGIKIVGGAPVDFVDREAATEEVLAWSGGRWVVAAHIKSMIDGVEVSYFMDARTDDLLDWPMHWVSLPEPPLQSKS